jgi:hypothetical protein
MLKGDLILFGQLLDLSVNGLKVDVLDSIDTVKLLTSELGVHLGMNALGLLLNDGLEGKLNGQILGLIISCNSQKDTKGLDDLAVHVENNDSRGAGTRIAARSPVGEEGQFWVSYGLHRLHCTLMC